MPTLSIRGERLAYRVSGKGEPLVLVHANISDIRSWEPLEGLLADSFKVVSYSRRYAHPNSPIADGGDDPFDVHVQDLIALIESQELGRVHLLGNSSGAFIALLAAASRPDLVRSLSLEEPPVVSIFVRTLPPAPAELIKLLVTAPGAFAAFVKFGAGAIGPATKAFKEGDDEKALDAFGKGVLGTEAFARISTARRHQMLDNVAAHRATLLRSGLPTFTADQARALRVSAQLIRGEHTAHFQRRINQRLAKLIPDARDVVIPDASHLVHEDNPAAVAAVVREHALERPRPSGRHQAQRRI
ncbi:alpha/beta fold hydrolase [Geodermatophilus poikilotrophus]|uniref:Pimeloyl-ACP methyl ester carboxylesterase n=1 Tax=Geodermatophilus poikilotrophus TaxID=1333667 RepID=A0A1H9YEG7_9ACTN|nr:alpha/beta hydrolase [Geodermatophilus poikilotrophus]SES67304.1 Pimeloyl-ACP methyl ester carboxylesterase [Geodermatophilus poikilotrophus]